MTKQNINISGSGGGNINIGNLVQAEGNVDVRGKVSITANQLRQQLLEELPSAPAGAPAGAPVAIQDRAAVERSITELSEAVAAPKSDPSRIKRILATIKEHHDWAFPAITGTLRKVAPWVIGLF